MTTGLLASFAAHTATIQRLSAAKDQAGYSVDTFSTLASGVQCLIYAATGSERTAFKRVAEYRSFIGSFPAGQDLQPKDRVVYTPSGDSARTLEVRAVRNIVMTDSTGGVSHIEADLELVGA